MSDPNAFPFPPDPPDFSDFSTSSPAVPEDDGDGEDPFLPPEYETTPFCPPSRQKTLEWLAVLGAAGIPVLPFCKEERWLLYVPRRQYQSAAEQLAEFEEECRWWPPVPAPFYQAPDPWVAINLFLTFMLPAFFFSVGDGGWRLANWSMPEWIIRCGAANSGLILNGEWWRCVTALTLHVNIPHVVANTASLALLSTMLARTIGPGLGWLMLVLAGALGNALAAWIAGPGHIAIGASTSVFAAVGILGGNRSLERFRTREQGAWLPLAAVAGVLALMGVAPGADIAGHVCGALVGLLMGWGIAWTRLKIRSTTWQAFLLLLTLSLIAGAWWQAVQAGAG